MSAILEFHQVGFAFGEKAILRDCSFSLEKGKVVRLTGPSGIGKTTFLNLCAGLEEPTSGYIDRATHRIGFVFQDTRLLPWKTTLGNVVVGLKARGVEKEKAVRIGMELLEEMGLAESASTYPIKLSGGMKRRVSLARALSLEPELLLLDEPLQGLDPELKGQVADVILRRARNSQAAMILVSHDEDEGRLIPGEVMQFGRDGRLTTVGK